MQNSLTNTGYQGLHTLAIKVHPRFQLIEKRGEPGKSLNTLYDLWLKNNQKLDQLSTVKDLQCLMYGRSRSSKPILSKVWSTVVFFHTLHKLDLYVPEPINIYSYSFCTTGHQPHSHLYHVKVVRVFLYVPPIGKVAPIYFFTSLRDGCNYPFLWSDCQNCHYLTILWCPYSKPDVGKPGTTSPTRCEQIIQGGSRKWWLPNW